MKKLILILLLSPLVSLAQTQKPSIAKRRETHYADNLDKYQKLFKGVNAYYREATTPGEKKKWGDLAHAYMDSVQRYAVHYNDSVASTPKRKP